MVSFNKLISHRFRGFAPQENTIAGLIAALDFGVQIVEFDIRVAGCGTPLIYHDEYALDKNGNKRYLSDVFAKDLSSIGGTFSYMPSVDALFEAAAKHRNNTCRLLIDIKDFGFEEEINALVHLHGLQDRCVYVSWVPNVLYRMAEIAPNIPQCLSHWPGNPNTQVRALHGVHVAPDGMIPRLLGDYFHGERSGWFVSGGLRGELRNLIAKSGGSVCLPVDMLDADLIQDYQKDGIEVSAFSFIDWKTMTDYASRYGLNEYFIDNKTVFDEHPARFRLASYGTLAPGRSNHHIMDGMTGTWSEGFVRGFIRQVMWDEKNGYPALTPNPNGEKIPVHIFESRDLPDHWARLDAFETDEYARIILPIETESGVIEASIYKSNHKG